MNLADHLASECMNQTDGSPLINGDAVTRVWSGLIPLTPVAQAQFLSAIEFAATGEVGAHARPTGWVVDLRETVVKGALLSSTLGAALYAAEATDLLPVVLTTVLPVVLDVKRITLSAGEEYLLSTLRLHPQFTRRDLSADEVYSMLPAEQRDQIGKKDLFDLMQKLVQIGEASEMDEKYTFGPSRRFRIRVSLK